MILRKKEVIQELGVDFIDQLSQGDTFGIKAIGKEHMDIVSFESYDDIVFKFKLNDVLFGVFFAELREEKVKLYQIV